jgi:hypothetical protein
LSALDRTTGATMWVALEESGYLTRTSLTLPEGVSEDEVTAIARMLSGIKRFTSFALGDLLLYAQSNYGDDFLVDVEEATGMAHQTLENLLSICRKVRPSVRRDGLSFGIHAVVAPLTPNEQRHWLKLAHENEWTRQRLRDEIYGEKVLPPAVPDNLPQIVQDALSGAREMLDGWWISRDSYVRLRAAVEGEE